MLPHIPKNVHAPVEKRPCQPIQVSKAATKARKVIVEPSQPFLGIIERIKGGMQGCTMIMANCRSGMAVRENCTKNRNSCMALEAVVGSKGVVLSEKGSYGITTSIANLQGLVHELAKLPLRMTRSNSIKELTT